MNVRLIAGRFGGRVIEGSGTQRTHPMGERVRNALFNKIMDDIDGATILDAFAGSGAVGLEALSRGATSAVFVEKDHIAQRIIEQNIALLRLDRDEARLIKGPVAAVAGRLDQSFDIIFADPPYHDPQLPAVIRLFDLLRPGGVLVLSYPETIELPEDSRVVLEENRAYGNAHLAFYRRNVE